MQSTNTISTQSINNNNLLPSTTLTSPPNLDFAVRSMNPINDTNLSLVSSPQDHTIQPNLPNQIFSTSTEEAQVFSDLPLSASSPLSIDVPVSPLQSKQPTPADQLFHCNSCNYSSPKKKLYNIHLQTEKHKKNLEKNNQVTTVENMTAEQLRFELANKEKIIQDLTIKLNNATIALSTSINNNNNNNSQTISEPVSLSEKTLKMQFVDVIQKLGSFAESTGKTETIPTLEIDLWPLEELKDYYFFTKRNNYEKKKKILDVPTVENWGQDNQNNSSEKNQQPESTTETAEPIIIPQVAESGEPSSEIFHVVSEYQYHYTDIDDSSLRTR